MNPGKIKMQFTKIESAPVPIVNDAIVGSRGIGDGRMIPLVILNTSSRPDIEELARIHKNVSSGDCTCRWGQIKKNSPTVLLFLEFIKPAEMNILLEFDIDGRGGLVDQILLSEALYIQPGRPDQRLMNTMDADRILIEIPDTGFKPFWNNILTATLKKKFRGRGLGKKASRQAAEGFIKEWRGFGMRRMLP